MTISLADINALKQSMTIFQNVMTPGSFTLVDTKAVVVVDCHIGIRSTGSPLRNSVASPLTGGSDQDTMVCLIFCDDWAASAATRPPKKGDVVEKDGTRYSIERVIKAAPGGVDMSYKAELKGG